MMQDHFLEALEQADIPLLRKMWKHIKPDLPQAETDADALVVCHMTRTGLPNIGFRHRAYSHAWLVERGLPSRLPDDLRPRAERMYPVAVAAVGIAVKNTYPISLLIRGAMEDAVRDAGVKDPPLTKRAILAARTKARRQLLGITGD